MGQADNSESVMGRAGPQLIVSKFESRGLAGADESDEGCRVLFFGWSLNVRF